MNHDSKRAKTIGLIGGLGVGATIHYYKTLVDAYRSRGQVPRLVIAHADVDRVLAMVRDRKLTELAHYLAGIADQLAAGGADFGAVTAITPHICIKETAARTRLPLVNLLDETAREIALRRLKRVAIFGTRFSIESDLFGSLGDVEVIRPRPEEIDYIHDTYVAIVNCGSGSAEQEQGLRKIAHALCRRDGVQSIVLAGTELALVFNEANTDFPALDCASIHIEAILRRAAA